MVDDAVVEVALNDENVDTPFTVSVFDRLSESNASAPVNVPPESGK